MLANISVASDNRKINVTYSNKASPSLELRNRNGFEVSPVNVFLFLNRLHVLFLRLCCASKQTCSSNDEIWVAAPADRVVVSKYRL